MAKVAVVTDSTATLPSELAEELGLRVVPMTVTFGDDSYISGVTLGAGRFYELLVAADALPTTSQPNPAWFEEAYADAYDDGHDAIVSIHLSSDLSGTCDLARMVGAQAALPVQVVDSRQAGGTLALAVLAAVRAAQDGDADAVVEAAERVAADARLWFVVDDLEYLKRGGRLTGAQAFLGTVLKVKPVLALQDGRVEPLEKVRTFSKAMERIATLAAERADGAPVDVVVMHGCAPDRAAAAWEQLDGRLDIRERQETVIGPILGTHLGPGAVGVAVARER